MLKQMLSGKIHRARVTARSLDYAGSITVDPGLADRAGIREYEKVLVANLSNGLRAETYAVSGRRGSGEVCLNGAAARLAELGDGVMITAFALVREDRIPQDWKPRIVCVDDDNRPLDFS